MAELDAVVMTNPTEEDFSERFNGELYTIKAGETKHYASNVSYHLAYKLSGKMLEKEFPWSKKKNRLPQEINQEATRYSQMVLYDNPLRRIALYKILRDVLTVQDALSKYPISLRGFLEGGILGTMEDYKTFVRKDGGSFEVKTDEKPTVDSLKDEIKELKKLILEGQKEQTKEQPKTDEEPKNDKS